MSQTPTNLPSPPEIPIAALHGSAADYLKALVPEYRQPVCVMLLRLLAAERTNRANDGEALKVLAALEISVASNLKFNTPQIRDEWKTPT